MMKRKAIGGVVLVTAALAFPTWVQAESDSLASPSVRALTFTEVDLLCYHFGYKEILPPPYKSTEKGLLPGLGVELVRLEKGPSLFARLVGEYTGANTAYDGTTQSGIPATGETNNTFLGAEGCVGLTLPAPSTTSLTVYTGLGYRSWVRKLGDEEVYGQAPYHEHYTWKYVPAGLRWDSRSKGHWGYGVDLSTQIMFGGMIRIYFTDIYPTLNDLDLVLGSRPGWKLQAPLRYRYLTVTPWFESSAIGQSNTDTLRLRGEPIAVGYEPSSVTRQYGLNVGVRLEVP